MNQAFVEHLQRAYLLSDWNKIAFPNWPVDYTVDSIVRGSMRFLLREQQLERSRLSVLARRRGRGICMTHDVETAAEISVNP